LISIDSNRKRGVLLQSDEQLGLVSVNKRGMSPLIATMLLIAFAVALGALIINIGPGIIQGDNKPDCSAITMDVNPYFCYAENLIKISVKNSGKAVESVTLKISDANADNNLVLKDSKLGAGAIMQKEVPYVKTGKTYVSLTPSIMFKDQAVPCPEPSIELEDLPNC
jgi:flagellin-like protein